MGPGTGRRGVKIPPILFIHRYTLSKVQETAGGLDFARENFRCIRRHVGQQAPQIFGPSRREMCRGRDGSGGGVGIELRAPHQHLLLSILQQGLWLAFVCVRMYS